MSTTPCWGESFVGSSLRHVGSLLLRPEMPDSAPGTRSRAPIRRSAVTAHFDGPPMNLRPLAIAALLAALAGPACAQDPQVLGDLADEARTPVSKGELTLLLTGAKVVSVSGRGNQRVWINDPSGSFVASSNNAAGAGQASTAQGKWHVSDDGRYCVLLEWRSQGPEQWCRFLFRSGDAYFASRSDKAATERLYKLQITK